MAAEVKLKKSDRLTPKQEMFARLSIEPQNTLLSSYKEAYDCKNMSDNAISVEASRLMQNPKIALKVLQLKQEIDQKTILRGSRLQDHVTSRLLQLSKGEGPVAVRSLELLGKTECMFSDKKVISSEEKSATEIETELLQRLAKLSS